MSTDALNVVFKTDGDVKTFGEVGGWIYLLLSWNLCEVEVVTGDRIQSLALVLHLWYAEKYSSAGAEVKNLTWEGPNFCKLLIGSMLSYGLGPSM